MKHILIIVLMALMPMTTLLAADNAPGGKSGNKQTVVLACDMLCQGCCDKIMKNIAWEKGVKDIVCDLKTKTVTLTFDTRKTDLDTLLKAFERIGKPAQLTEQTKQP